MGTDQLTKMFKAECRTAICHDMVMVEGIKEVGLCEHHLLPIIMKPLGVAVLIDGKHMCAMARGVRDTHSSMKVNVMHGVFQKDQHVRSEFLMRLSSSKVGGLLA
jgi:GTP cyclohydrolase I